MYAISQNTQNILLCIGNTNVNKASVSSAHSQRQSKTGAEVKQKAETN